MATLLEILNKTRDFFTRKGLPGARLEAETLLAATLGMKRLDLYLKFERPLSDAELAMLRERVTRRAAREPLQYVLGSAHFRELILRCDARALIPRPETEEFVGHILERLPSGPVRLADLGCGGGAIALSLAKENPSAEVVAVDRLPDALELTRENTLHAGLGARVTTLESDWFSKLTGAFDAVVSNPPYLTGDELASAEPEVRDHEPHSALVAAAAGLADLEKILRGARVFLKRGGFVALETGVDHHAALAKLSEESGYKTCASLRDASGRDRFFFAAL